ncbi:creatinase [Pseudoclavibacter sp. AY1F1]|uniref:M24 family metallopeptidase n=1 Tax=Pseudoclavibacter sp. AY1F1 TaxID=2080583 RepID=UPI000CE830C6|nr:M24 family metallopeptidase [Pseudoclavibacter sp. AY1F1]PPF46208.1 creatinase [Pseudoclavibacter sp. AY1F1]
MSQLADFNQDTSDFSRQEFDVRLANTRVRMEDEGLDALLVTDPANLYYLTGYNAWSFYMPQFLYVPAEGDLLLVMRAMDAHGAHHTTWLPSDQVAGYPENLVHRAEVHPMDWAATELRERGQAARRMRVGYESEAHFFSVRSFLTLQRRLPEWDLVDSRELVNWVRLVKSQAELSLMRTAAAVSSNAMAVGIKALRGGRRQSDVAAEIQAAQAAGVGDAEGDYPSIVPMMLAGEGADTPHLTWSSAQIVAGEAVSLELAGAHRRYHAPLARTVSLGQPSAELQRVAATTLDGFEAALELLRPGQTPDAAVAAWDAVLAKQGLSKASRLGYSIGIGYPPDWGEHTVSIRAGEETVLAPNMTFHLIAGMWMTGFGFEVSESIRITETGVEVLTSAPRELIVKGDA